MSAKRPSRLASFLLGACSVGAFACSSGSASPDGGADSGHEVGRLDTGGDSFELIDTSMPPRDSNPYAYNEAAPSCQPAPPDRFEPTKVAPVKNPACTAAQVTGMVTQCFDPFTGTGSACSTWRADAANEACLAGCPVISMFAAAPALSNPPPPPKGPWGPLVEIVSDASIVFLNLGGCVAASDPSPAAQSCADAMNAQLECEYYVCAGNCPIPTSVDASTVQAAEGAFQNCTLAADSGPCMAYANAANACIAKLPAGGPAEFCLDGSLLSGDSVTFDPAFEKLVGDQCGGKPAPDAGPPDVVSTEAGDAASDGPKETATGG
jgi:hypothetical protein